MCWCICSCGEGKFKILAEDCLDSVGKGAVKDYEGSLLFVHFVHGWEASESDVVRDGVCRNGGGCECWE